MHCNIYVIRHGNFRFGHFLLFVTQHHNASAKLHWMSERLSNVIADVNYKHIKDILSGSPSVASHADVLRGSSHGAGTRDEPRRTSVWEASPSVVFSGWLTKAITFQQAIRPATYVALGLLSIHSFSILCNFHFSCLIFSLHADVLKSFVTRSYPTWGRNALQNPKNVCVGGYPIFFQVYY